MSDELEQPPVAAETWQIGAMVVAASAALSACGGGGGGASTVPGGAVVTEGVGVTGPTGVVPLDTTGTTFQVPATDEQAVRFLLQAQLSASDADIAAVRAAGYAPWLSQQMARTGPTGWDWLDAKGYGDVLNPANHYDQTVQGDHMVWNQLLTCPDPVRKRCALALSELFVVSLTGLDFSWRSHGIAAWWDLLAQQAFGNFRALLEAVTLNPSMGVWLNTKGNQKENTSTGRLPDENYAREVMQLMTIGLVELNPDGTERRDGQGNRIDSYTQADVTNLARVFTGYDFDFSQNQPTVVNGRTIPSTAYTRLPMTLTASRHSTLAATFLGTTIPANTPGATALRIALDTLFNHPNTGPFFARQMIQRLVTSNPSPAYVGRVAAKFANNGAGVRGDLHAVFGAILLDDEARGPQGLADPSFGKLREPMLRFVQWGRTFGLQSASDTWRIGDLSNPATQLGQSPLRSPSVFNFFRPGYVPPSTALATGRQVAPEFQIVTESSVGGYLNYMQERIRNGVNTDMQAAYTQELAIVADAAALVRRLSLLLTAGQLGAPTLALITNAVAAVPVTATSTDSARRNRVAAAVLLVMASAEYLVQK
jgi:uncharacterized protein (DUF1800 family)